MKFFRVFFAFSIAAILAGCATNSDRINERLAGIPESGRAYLTGNFCCGMFATKRKLLPHV
ncbi:MAG: hypothetical protein IPF65_06850 [Polaromonas sp.]|nr:hypothetical protein [Polaromonas sp.]